MLSHALALPCIRSLNSRFWGMTYLHGGVSVKWDCVQWRLEGGEAVVSGALLWATSGRSDAVSLVLLVRSQC